MRKEYKTPLSVVLDYTTDFIYAASNGDTIQEKVSDDTTIDGDKAWSRSIQDNNIWEEDW